MATTRRPQINHKACNHAATPTARKACRKAHRAAEQGPALVPARYGKGKVVHAMRTTGGLAGTILCITNDFDITRGLPVAIDAPAVTCKRCLAHA